MTTPMASAPKQLETKWTPGPWFAVPYSQSVGICTKENGRYADRVAECHHWSPPGKGQPDRAQSLANARLIAAAPEMAEALQDICLSLECAAGCYEDVSPEDAYTEILSAFGSAPAVSYTSVRALLAKIGGDV